MSFSAFSQSIQWHTVDASSSAPAAIPAARTYATLVAYGQNLYLFGGYGESKGRFNDVYEYNTSTRAWRLISDSTGDIPKPIYLHSACVATNQMVVFGGNSGKETPELYMYNLDASHWQHFPSPANFFAGGQSPPARYGHASCIYGSNGSHLLIVGGCKSNNSYFKDAWSMELSTRKWRKLEDLPLELAYHSLITWEDKAYLHGGYNGKTFVPHMYSLDSASGKWTIVHTTTPQSAPPLLCGSATIMRGSELFVFGGYTEKGHTNNFYRFHFPSRAWTLIPTENKPLPRAYLQAALIGSNCYIFGGYDGSNCISDFRMITLPASLDPPVAPPLMKSSQPSSVPSNNNPPFPSNPFSSASSIHNPFTEQFFTLPPHAATDILLTNYARGSNNLSRTELLVMCQALTSSWNVSLNAARSVSGSSSGSNSGFSSQPSYPFDTSAVSSLEGLGFTREQILRVMQRMYAAGQNTKNVDLIADLCLKDGDANPTPAPSSAAANGKSSSGTFGLDQLSLDRQGSSGAEKAALTKKVQDLQDAEDEFRTCKVCFDAQINCALQDCGHLAMCTTCAISLKQKQLPCPICQRPIKSFLKVYFT